MVHDGLWFSATLPSSACDISRAAVRAGDNHINVFFLRKANNFTGWVAAQQAVCASHARVDRFDVFQRHFQGPSVSVQDIGAIDFSAAVRHQRLLHMGNDQFAAGIARQWSCHLYRRFAGARKIDWDQNRAGFRNVKCIASILLSLSETA